MTQKQARRALDLSRYHLVYVVGILGLIGCSVYSGNVLAQDGLDQVLDFYGESSNKKISIADPIILASHNSSPLYDVTSSLHQQSYLGLSSPRANLTDQSFTINSNYQIPISANAGDLLEEDIEDKEHLIAYQQDQQINLTEQGSIAGEVSSPSKAETLDDENNYKTEAELLVEMLDNVDRLIKIDADEQVLVRNLEIQEGKKQQLADNLPEILSKAEEKKKEATNSSPLVNRSLQETSVQTNFSDHGVQSALASTSGSLTTDSQFLGELKDQTQTSNKEEISKQDVDKFLSDTPEIATDFLNNVNQHMNQRVVQKPKSEEEIKSFIHYVPKDVEKNFLMDIHVDFSSIKSFAESETNLLKVADLFTSNLVNNTEKVFIRGTLDNVKVKYESTSKVEVPIANKSVFDAPDIRSEVAQEMINAKQQKQVEHDRISKERASFALNADLIRDQVAVKSEDMQKSGSTIQDQDNKKLSYNDMLLVYTEHDHSQTLHYLDPNIKDPNDYDNRFNVHSNIPVSEALCIPRDNLIYELKSFIQTIDRNKNTDAIENIKDY